MVLELDQELFFFSFGLFEWLSQIKLVAQFICSQ